MFLIVQDDELMKDMENTSAGKFGVKSKENGSESADNIAELEPKEKPRYLRHRTLQGSLLTHLFYCRWGQQKTITNVHYQYYSSLGEAFQIDR